MSIFTILKKINNKSCFSLKQPLCWSLSTDQLILRSDSSGAIFNMTKPERTNIYRETGTCIIASPLTVTVPTQSSCWHLSPALSTHTGIRQGLQEAGWWFSSTQSTLSLWGKQMYNRMCVGNCFCALIQALCVCILVCILVKQKTKKENTMCTHKYPTGNGSHHGNIYLCW